MRRASRRRRRSPGARLLGQIRQAEGAPKRLLYIGTAIVALFLILAIFAPLIAPYGFDQVESHGVRFPKQAPPSGRTPSARPCSRPTCSRG